MSTDGMGMASKRQESPASAPNEAEPAGSTGDAAAMLMVARRYYHHDQSKVEIARELGISRFQVARLLQSARRQGFVRIEVGAPGLIDPDLSSELANRLGVRRAVVVTTHPDGAGSANELVGKVMATVLAETITDGSTLGVTWSRPIAAMAQNLTRLPRLTVVQLTGVVYPPEGMPGSVEVARAIAEPAGGMVHLLYAPLILPDCETAAGLRRQVEIAATLDRHRQLDYAVLSVGAWAPGVSAVYELLPESDRVRLADLGVCGEVFGRLLDAEGTAVDNPLDGRLISATLDQLRAVPNLLMSSVGVRRAAATRAAVRAGLAHTLIVDDELAQALLS